MTNDEAKAWLEAQGADAGEVTYEGKLANPRTFRAYFWKDPEQPSGRPVEHVYAQVRAGGPGEYWLGMKRFLETTGGLEHLARGRRDEPCPDDCQTCALKAEAAKQ